MSFHHIAIVSTDIQRSVDWYSQKLDCKVSYQDESWAMVESENMKIALVLKDQHPPHIAFKVSSTVQFPCDESQIKIHRDGSSYYYGTDPDGNIVEWLVYTDDDE